MKRGLELTTTILSKLSGDKKLGIPEPQATTPAKYLQSTLKYLQCISTPDRRNISIYMSVYENPIFLLGLLGFAGVFL